MRWFKPHGAPSESSPGPRSGHAPAGNQLVRLGTASTPSPTGIDWPARVGRCSDGVPSLPREWWWRCRGPPRRCVSELDFVFMHPRCAVQHVVDTGYQLYIHITPPGGARGERGQHGSPTCAPPFARPVGWVPVWPARSRTSGTCTTRCSACLRARDGEALHLRLHRRAARHRRL